MPAQFASETGGMKALDEAGSDPNFATIYPRYSGSDGIEAALDPRIRVTAGVGSDLRHAPSPMVPEMDCEVSAGCDALSAKSQRGWRLLGSAMGRR